MEDERDAESAIHSLDRTEFGRQRRRLCVEWTKHPDRGSRRAEGGKRSSGSLKPTKTLFVINFDPFATRVRDIERHFEPYGKLLNVRIRRNFAFVQFETQDEATKALDNTHLSKILDKVITVEYAQREDADRRDRSSPPRRGSRYDRDRDRSVSPAYGRRATRGSPDYGRAPSPVYTRRQERHSPDYTRAPSPFYSKRAERSSPEYRRADSPAYEERPRKSSADYGRASSPNNERERSRSRSPARQNGQ